MLTDNEGIRSGMLWGVAFMVASFYFLIFYPLAIKFFSLAVQLSVFESATFFIVLSAFFHLRGYIYLAEKFDSKLLKWSSITFCAVLVVFGVSLMVNVPAFLFRWSLIHALTLGIVEGALFAFGAAAFAFAVAQVMLYKKFGILALFTALNGTWIYFFWHPWPAILLFIPSTYLLYKSQE